jgi:hypothetical protein
MILVVEQRSYASLWKGRLIAPVALDRDFRFHEILDVASSIREAC